MHTVVYSVYLVLSSCICFFQQFTFIINNVVLMSLFKFFLSVVEIKFELNIKLTF